MYPKVNKYIISTECCVGLNIITYYRFKGGKFQLIVVRLMRISFYSILHTPLNGTYILVNIVIRATVVNCCLFNLMFFRGKKNLPCEGYTLCCGHFALSIHIVTNSARLTDI